MLTLISTSMSTTLNREDSGVLCDSLVEKLLQALSPLFDEGVVKNPVISTEWELAKEGFSRKGWNHHLKKMEKERKKEKSREMNKTKMKQMSYVRCQE